MAEQIQIQLDVKIETLIEWNNQRAELGLSWEEVIGKGLEALKNAGEGNA